MGRNDERGCFGPCAGSQSIYPFGGQRGVPGCTTNLLQATISVKRARWTFRRARLKAGVQQVLCGRRNFWTGVDQFLVAGKRKRPRKPFIDNERRAVEIRAGIDWLSG